MADHRALTFVEYHRLTAVSYKLPLLDTLVGLAGLLAEANGITRAGHVRDNGPRAFEQELLLWMYAGIARQRWKDRHVPFPWARAEARSSRASRAKLA